MKRTILASAVTAALLLGVTQAEASLVLVAPQNFGGSGLGAVNTILTIQNTGTETGGVAWNGTTDVVSGPDVKTGASQTQTRTLGQLGVSSASDLRVVFNANQISDGPITLSNLVLKIYSTSGTVLFTSGAFASQPFANTFTGTGNSGFVFALDSAQAAAAQASAFTGSWSSYRVGLAATATLANDGQETFFVASAGTPLAGPVPEPGTLGLLATGLLAIAGIRRRRPKN